MAVRVEGTHSQVITRATDPDVQVSSLHVQVLLPPPSVNVKVEASYLTVLVSLNYVRSASDGETPILIKHTDGSWLPVYIKDSDIHVL